MPDRYIPPPCFEEVGILYVDEVMVVVEKPAGLLSVPGRDVKDSVYRRLLLDYADVTVVHRLDLDTSGLMVLARGKPAVSELNRQFRQREIKKRYLADVYGILEPGEGKIDLPLAHDPVNRPLQRVDFDNGKAALTHYEVQRANTGSCRVSLKPVTGRSHQLRLHMAAINHPILGCDLYAHAAAFEAANRLMLHASGLSFFHPASGDWISFESPCPF